MRILGILTVAVLGLTSGAMLTEAVIIVPFWLGLTPTEFYTWYAKNQAALVNFYSPLEISSMVLALVLSILFFTRNEDKKWVMLGSAILSILVIATFFVFFKDANAAFNARSIEEGKLSLAIMTWGNWQWFRVFLGLGAFVLSVMAIQGSKKIS
ncbi:MAG: DUF1772 domain-containing protein [Spirochaetia bacterium]|nr:DUF1772 domain-containing protein [Spirochaetia bacterium]